MSHRETENAPHGALGSQIGEGRTCTLIPSHAARRFTWFYNLIDKVGDARPYRRTRIARARMSPSTGSSCNGFARTSRGRRSRAPTPTCLSSSEHSSHSPRPSGFHHRLAYRKRRCLHGFVVKSCPDPKRTYSEELLLFGTKNRFAGLTLRTQIERLQSMPSSTCDDVPRRQRTCEIY